MLPRITSSFTQRSGSRFSSLGDRSDIAFSGANLNAAEFAAFRKEPRLSSRFRASSTPILAQNNVIALDDSIASARDIAIGSTAITINDSVSTADSNDYFRFTLTQNSTFRLSLNGLTDDADVMLLNSSGSVIGGSKQPGTTAESINRQLGAGT